MSDTNYDTIIIGTGLGGLVCGYILAKNGHKVLLLEKNAQIGGCLQNFHRFGVKYDTGMHYIGSMEEDQILHQMFSYLGLLKDVRVSRMDDDGFDRFSIAGQEYRYAAGYEHFVETLSQQFPDCRKDIQSYVSHIKDIAESSPLYKLNDIETRLIESQSSPYLHTSVNEFLASITPNKQLQQVLAANLPLYAGVADKTPAYVYILISNFYLQSAWRIIGGSDSIARSLANSIRSFGGNILTNSEVKRLICDNTKATAVELSNGERFEASHFVSDIHPQALLPLIDSKLLRPVYRERIRQLDNTLSNFTIYLKFKENKVPYMNHNYYYYADKNVWDAYHAGSSDSRSFLYMHQCMEEHQQYAESAEIMAPMSYQEVATWANSHSGCREAVYYDFKRRKAEQYLQLLEQSFPGIKQHIEAYETSSPLTYRDYTGTSNGSTYGILHDIHAPELTRVSQRTKIPNLFLTGQNIHWHGILGVIVGAILASRELTVDN